MAALGTVSCVALLWSVSGAAVGERAGGKTHQRAFVSQGEVSYATHLLGCAGPATKP